MKRSDKNNQLRAELGIRLNSLTDAQKASFANYLYGYLGLGDASLGKPVGMTDAGYSRILESIRACINLTNAGGTGGAA
jgi:hypothetical protein